MQSVNKDSTSRTFCKSKRTMTAKETDKFKHEHPAVTTFDDNNNDLIVSEEENVCHPANSEESLSGSSRPALEQCQSNTTDRTIRGRGCENTSAEQFRENLHKSSFYGMLHLISGYRENKRFSDGEGVSQTIIPQGHSNSSVASRNFDSDGRSSNTDRSRYQEESSSFRRKEIGSSYSSDNNHKTEAPRSSNMFQNISSGQLAPIIYQIANPASNNVQFNRDGHLSESKTHSMTFNEDENDDFKVLFCDSMKVTDSEILSHITQPQFESSGMTFSKDELFELDAKSDCSSDNQDEDILMHCDREKIIETESDFQGTKSLSRKVLNKIDLNETTIFPLQNIQPLKNQTNDEAFVSFNLTNVRSVSQITTLNNSMFHNEVLSNLSHPKSEVSLLGCPVKSRSMILETSTHSVEDAKPEDPAKQLVWASTNKLSDNFLTFSPEMEYIQKKGFSNYYEYSKTKSARGFEGGRKNRLSLPKAQKPIQSSKKRNLFPKENEKKNLDEEISQQTQNFHFNTRDFEVEQNSADNREVFDTNNCGSQNSEEDYYSFDDLSEDEDIFYEVDNFYELLDTPFESLESISETKLCSTDGDSPAMGCEASSSVLTFQEPIIFKYVDDNTQEEDEILIYPKDCMENVSKNGDRTLTREEILPKLLELSKFYDGKPIGIVTHVRAIRKAMKNKSILNVSENLTRTFTAHGYRNSSLSPCKDVRKKNSKKTRIPVCVEKNKRNIYAKTTSKIRIQGKCSTSKQKPCSESETIPKSFPQTFKKLNTHKTKQNKSQQLVDKDSSGVLHKVYNISTEKCHNGKGDYHKETSRAISDILINSSINSNLQYRNNEREDNQLRATSVEDAIPVRASSPVRKLDITFFKQRTFHIKSVEQSSTHLERKSRPTSSTNFCRKGMWGSTSRPTGPSALEVLGESSLVRRCSSARFEKWSTLVQVDDASPLALLKYDGSSPAVVFARRLRIPVRRSLTVEDIVASNFRAYFCFYAKIGKRFRSGSAICKVNSNHWLRRTGVVFDADSMRCAEDWFDVVARHKLVLNIYDYVQYLTIISRKRKACLFDLVRQLKSVDISAEQHGKRDEAGSVGSGSFHRSLPSRSPFTLLSRGRDSNPKLPSQRNSKIPGNM